MGDVYSTKPYRPNQRMAPFATDLILCIFFFFLCPVFHYHLKTLEKPVSYTHLTLPTNREV